MRTASIIKLEGKILTVRDHDGQIYKYEQGAGVESPTMIHADMLWPKGFEKRVFNYEGDRLPAVLIVRDGGVPDYHEYNRRTTT